MQALDANNRQINFQQEIIPSTTFAGVSSTLRSLRDGSVDDAARSATQSLGWISMGKLRPATTTSV